jgi:hypothetical protein
MALANGGASKSHSEAEKNSDSSGPSLLAIHSKAQPAFGVVADRRADELG